MDKAIAWRKASYSNGQADCVEVGQADWRKARYSNGQAQCVEVGGAPGAVYVRDTKDRAAGALAFPATAWTAFLASVR